MKPGELSYTNSVEVSDLNSKTRSSITFLRILELIGGLGIVLITLLLYCYLDMIDASHHVQVAPSVSAGAFLIVVVPAMVGAVGCYLHSIRRKNWALAILFVAGVFNLVFVVMSAGFNYAFIQDKWGQRVLLADFVGVMFMFATAFINTILTMRFPNDAK